MLTKQEPMSWSLLQNNEKSILIHNNTIQLSFIYNFSQKGSIRLMENPVIKYAKNHKPSL